MMIMWEPWVTTTTCKASKSLLYITEEIMFSNAPCLWNLFVSPSVSQHFQPSWFLMSHLFPNLISMSLCRIGWNIQCKNVKMQTFYGAALLEKVTNLHLKNTSLPGKQQNWLYFSYFYPWSILLRVMEIYLVSLRNKANSFMKDLLTPKQ